MNFFSWDLKLGDIDYRFWIQFNPQGEWIFCMNHPHNCLKASSKSFDDFGDIQDLNDTHYQFQIGPTFYTYTGNSFTPSPMTSASLYNVWFVSEGFDLVMFAGT